MRRSFAALAVLALATLLVAPVASAADGAPGRSGSVLFAAQDDITVPAGEHVDAVIVIGGTATIAGATESLVVLDGRAVIDGGTVESVVAVRSPVDLLAGSVVSGDIMKIDSLVTKHGDGTLLGVQRDLATEIAGVGFFLGPLFILLYAGFALAAVAAGLLLAGLAGRQVREAGALISGQPGTTFLVGLGAAILPMLLIVGLFVTVIGAPLALAILFGLWPLAAFIGYLVAGIWIGDWLLRRSATHPVERRRPYLASVIGIVILQVLALWPFLSAIASLFGLGAVVRLAIRTLRGTPEATPTPGLAVPIAQPG